MSDTKYELFPGFMKFCEYLKSFILRRTDRLDEEVIELQESVSSIESAITAISNAEIDALFDDGTNDIDPNGTDEPVDPVFPPIIGPTIPDITSRRIYYKANIPVNMRPDDIYLIKTQTITIDPLNPPEMVILEAPVPPTIEGYQFTVWSPTIPGTIPYSHLSGSKTYTAIYEAI